MCVGLHGGRRRDDPGRAEEIYGWRFIRCISSPSKAQTGTERITAEGDWSRQVLGGGAKAEQSSEAGHHAASAVKEELPGDQSP